MREKVAIGLPVVIVASHLSCAESDFPTQPEQPAEITDTRVAGTSTWPDSIPVDLGAGDTRGPESEDRIGIDTLEVTITTPAGQRITGLDVEWESSDPQILTVTEVAPPAAATVEDSLAAQLRAEVIARSRGQATVTARIVGGRGIVASGDAVRKTITVTERWTAVTVGGDHVCGIASDSLAYCWGRGREGQLGNGSFSNVTEPPPKPARVRGDIKFTVLDAGAQHTCGLASRGQLYCWGWNIAGELGDLTTAQRSLPVLVVINQDVQAVSAGAAATCYVGVDRLVYCWGKIETGVDAFIPDTLPDSFAWGHKERGVEASRCAGSDRCSLQANTPVQHVGEYYNWDPEFGWLPLPFREQISVGGEHVCAIGPQVSGHTASDGLNESKLPVDVGTIQCWGLDTVHQLGVPPEVLHVSILERTGDRVMIDLYKACDPPRKVNCVRRATEVPPLSAMRFRSIAAGLDGPDKTTNRDGFFRRTGISHTCAVAESGEMYCWGGNQGGELGVVPDAMCSFTSRHLGQGEARSWGCTTQPARVPHPEARQWVQVSAGYRHTCALDEERVAYCWGSNGEGQLGRENDGSIRGGDLVEVRLSPEMDQPFVSIEAGGNQTCGRTFPELVLYCWGDRFGSQPVRVRDPDPSS